MVKKRLYATTKLKNERESRGFNQREMARLISIQTGFKISPSVYQKWEQGSRTINPEVLILIERFLGYEEGELAVEK